MPHTTGDEVSNDLREPSIKPVNLMTFNTTVQEFRVHAKNERCNQVEQSGCVPDGQTSKHETYKSGCGYQGLSPLSSICVPVDGTDDMNQSCNCTA